MKRIKLPLAVLSLSLALAACGGDKKSAATPAPATKAIATGGPWTDTAMQNLVAQKCASAKCHDGTQIPNFVNYKEADMRAYIRAAVQVSSLKMPPPPLSFNDAEKAIFAKFYSR